MTIRTIVVAFSVASFILLAGCTRESPSETAKDVGEARQEATEDITDARADAATELADASTKAHEDVRDTAAEGSYEVAVTEAEASHKIAIEQCGTLVGDARTTCTDSADNDLNAAKESAEIRYKSAQ